MAESNGSLLPGLWRNSLHVTCGLTACTLGSAPGPTLGNEYGKNCKFLLPHTGCLQLLEICKVMTKWLIRSWCWKMLQENFLISNVIFALQAIFNTLYTGKSSGKQDHCDLRAYHKHAHYKFHLHFDVKIFWISPGNWLGLICRHPVVIYWHVFWHWCFTR